MKLISKNKRAYHDYDIKDTIEAGIILYGHEVKALREGKIDMRDAVVRANGNEAHIFNLDIPRYSKASLVQLQHYDKKRKRGLLLHKREITKLTTKTNKTWLILIPLQIYFTKKQRVKVLLWLCKLLRKVQKKNILKEKDVKRDMDRQAKNFRL